MSDNLEMALIPDHVRAETPVNPRDFVNTLNSFGIDINELNRQKIDTRTINSIYQLNSWGYIQRL